jgi:hypothetical protein
MGKRPQVMPVREEQVRAVMRQIKGPPVQRGSAVTSQWRRANAQIAAAMRASLAQQQQPPRPPAHP